MSGMPSGRCIAAYASQLFILLSISAQISNGQVTGSLRAYVYDVTTNQPLVGANVMVADTEYGAATGVDGYASLPQLSVGSHTIRTEMIGYGSLARANVQILHNRETVLNLALEQEAVEGEEIVVTGMFFERTRDAVSSARSFGIEEIRSDPAGVYDIQKMMEALPAVVMNADQNNEIIVRGGGVGENLFIMDNMEIPNPNHFGEPGATGGAINIINTDFIERIDFYAGAFPARYGGKMSSVMDVSLRDGNRNRHQTALEVSMAGVGTIIEGPIAKGRGAYLGSVRRSFLDYVIKDVGLTAVPHYSNWQARINYDLNRRSQLILNWLGGIDGIDLKGSNVPQSRGIDNVLADGHQQSYGITLKSLFSERGYVLATLSRSDVGMDYRLYNVLPDGYKQEIIDLDDVDSQTTLKADVTYSLSKRFTIDAGLKQQWINLERNTVVGGDTLWTYRYLMPGESMARYVDADEYYTHILPEDDPTVIRDDAWLLSRERHVNDSVYTAQKLAVYGQVNWVPIKQLEVVGGLRNYSVSATNSRHMAGRLGAIYHMSNRLQFNVAAGRHVQAPLLFQVINNVGVELKDMMADQAVLGMSYLLADDAMFSFEVYGKRYSDLVTEYATTTSDTTDEWGGYVNAGDGYASGMEFFLQKKLSSNWYGSLAYSRYRSIADDPREGWEGTTYPRNSDFRKLLTVIGGYKIKFMGMERYDKMRNTKWWPALAWMPFAPADEFEASFRLRHVGGRPYTKRSYNPTVRRWFEASTTELNNHRMDDYWRFDILLLRRFYLKRFNLVTFINIQNVLGRDNPWDNIYYHDGTTEVAMQYKQFPVGGLTVEF